MGQGGPPSGTGMRMRERKAPQVRVWGSGFLGLREEGLVLRGTWHVLLTGPVFLPSRATRCRNQSPQWSFLPPALQP